MADSTRFEELQKASARDVKAVGMVGASTSLEMVEYTRELERRLNFALAAYAQICPFALSYAEAGGRYGPEMRTYRRAEKMYDAAAEYYDGELDGLLIESRMAKCYDCGEDFETYDESIPDGGIGRCDDCAEEERYDEMYDAAAEYYDGELEGADWPEN